jgi:sensor c-di-GMP phosphodiesterase-like protein
MVNIIKRALIVFNCFSCSSLRLFRINQSVLEDLSKKNKLTLMDKIVLWRVKSIFKVSIAREDFHRVYQPFYDFNEQMIYGAEVLARYKSKRFGSLSPLIFIPLLEKTNLISSFGDWILERSLEDVSKWISSGSVDESFFISVNVSALQLEDKEFSLRLFSYMALNDLKPKQVQIEITETKAIDGNRAIKYQIDNIKRRGVSIALDDFGTGFSNLIYLKTLSIDCIKIDKAFLYEGTASNSILDLMISMADELGIKTICEGVETVEQSISLSDRGCFNHQGRLISMPVTDEHFLNCYKEKNTPLQSAH